MPSKCDPMDLGRVEHEVDEDWQDEHCVYLSLGFHALTESSIMTAQGVEACQFGPSIHRSAQSIAVIVNGMSPLERPSETLACEQLSHGLSRRFSTRAAPSCIPATKALSP
jgi:hypothetical protein